MANRNPSPLTRFQAGNNGGAHRKKGARDRITSKFLEELAEVWDLNGRPAIEAMLMFDTTKFVQMVADLVPKEVEIKRPMHGVDDATIDEIIERLTVALGAAKPETDEQDEAVH